MLTLSRVTWLEELARRNYIGECVSHTQGALNIFEHTALDELFFDASEANILRSEAAAEKRIPIFYCEYSQKRGPSM